MSSTVTAGTEPISSGRCTAANSSCTLNIPSRTEQLAAEVAQLAHESRPHAVRVSLREREERLLRQSTGDRIDRLTAVLADEIWPQVPADMSGRAPTKAEREDILGYGPDGL